MRISETLEMQVTISLSFAYVIIASNFPSTFGSYQEIKCSYFHGEDVLRELNPPQRLAKFFDPDCEKRKLIFRPDKQGCLGALRWLEEFVGPNKTFGKYNTPVFKRIACSHKRCKNLPAFRKCGSNQHNKANPRSFRNGCRQCAASCKEVVAGRRRYVRLENSQCPKLNQGDTTLSQKPPPHYMLTPATGNDKGGDNLQDSSPTDFNSKQLTTVPTSATQFTLESTLTAQTTAAESSGKLTTERITTALSTTELLTTEAECDDVKLPVRKSPSTVYCISTKVKQKINCSRIALEFENDFELPRLPSWQPKETNDG